MDAVTDPPVHPAGTLSLSAELAQRLGIISPRHGLDPEPTTPMDHALQWARRGLFVFPCSRFLGLPLVQKWHRDATTATSTIVEHWSNYPTADIAGVPDRSGHFVILAVKEQHGDVSLMDLEDELGELPADFRYTNRRGDVAEGRSYDQPPQARPRAPRARRRKLRLLARQLGALSRIQIGGPPCRMVISTSIRLARR